MRTCTLRCALVAAGLLALAGLSGAATGTTGAASPASASSAASAPKVAATASAPAATGHPSAAGSKAPAPQASAAKAAAAPPLIDINGASHKQLKALPGLSDAQIDKLIASRPYLSKAELVSKEVIPTATYLSIKYLIIAKQPQQPKTKPKGV